MRYAAEAGDGRAPRMISYAQNAEDVLLRRLFSEDCKGFYIDVGAHDPTNDSVTRYFYEQGWRGINIEPMPGPFEKLVEERPRDVNLNLGLAEQEGTLSFYEAVDPPGLSTFSDALAADHESRGVEFTRRSVPVTTLAALCERHGVDSVDFLSIDVEGYEREVLLGADFSRWRPLAVVVEATRPNTTEPSHASWEPLLLREGYRFATFDGLNRYYVRAEDSRLIERLQVPANWFDNYVPYRFWLWKREVELLNHRLERRERCSLKRSTLALARRLQRLVSR